MRARLPARLALASIAVALLTGLAEDMRATGMFPPGLWKSEGSNAGADQNFTDRWYGNQLLAMHEKPLWPKTAVPKGATVERLLVLPTFRPALMVRVERLENGPAKITVTMLDGAGGYEPGKVAVTRQFSEPERALAGLDARMRATRLWSLPLEEPYIALCTDGVQFAFERRDDSGYRLISRHQCDLTPPLEKLIATWLETGGIDPTPGPRGAYHFRRLGNRSG